MVHPSAMLGMADGGRRGSVVLGVILVVVGLLAIVGRQLDVNIVAIGWPLFVIVPGILLLAGSVFVGGRRGFGWGSPVGTASWTGLVLAFRTPPDTSRRGPTPGPSSHPA